MKKRSNTLNPNILFLFNPIISHIKVDKYLIFILIYPWRNKYFSISNVSDGFRQAKKRGFCKIGLFQNPASRKNRIIRRG